MENAQVKEFQITPTVKVIVASYDVADKSTKFPMVLDISIQDDSNADFQYQEERKYSPGLEVNRDVDFRGFFQEEAEKFYNKAFKAVNR